MRLTHILISALLVLSSVARAEIEKLVMPADKGGVAFHFWPKLPAVEGWHQDREQSLLQSINALAPNGFSFENADAVMYAKAIYKPLMPEIKSLEALIEMEKMDAAASIPDVIIREVPALSTADGQKLRSFIYFSKDKSLWERVSYGQEGDFYLLFTISSSSLAAFNSAASAYEKLVTSYNK